MNLLTVHEASLRYKGLSRLALDRVSLSVGRGETLGIVDESGSGKSSLARAMLGVEALSSGCVKFKGQDLALQSPAERYVFRRAVQMVFQDPYHSLNPRMTVGSAIAEALLVHRLAHGQREAASQVITLLGRVGLGANAGERYPHELSGGQRQRVGIARALAVSPEILIADEPVSALDVSVQAHILNLLATLVSETGVTLVLIAHDLAVVRAVCDRIVVMHDGIVVEEGAAGDVIDRPQADYTRKLIASVPEL